MSAVSNPTYRFGVPIKVGFATEQTTDALVGLIMGSQSDWPFMQPCADMLEELQIPFEFGVVSAHRTPERMVQYAHTSTVRGLHVIIACAGGSAHLPGMVASETWLPTLGVSPKKDDVHAVGSMIAMPAGKPLAYMGGGSGPGKNAGATNAALMAASILALRDKGVRDRLTAYHNQLRDSVPFNCF